MGAREDANRVKKNILTTFQRRQAAIFAISAQYAVLAIQKFKDEQDTGLQTEGKFWFNRTNQAVDRMFTVPFIDGLDVGWRMGHGVEYGVYLELANDRRNEAIRPTVRFFTDRRRKNNFFRAVARLYTDRAV